MSVPPGLLSVPPHSLRYASPSHIPCLFCLFFPHSRLTLRSRVPLSPKTDLAFRTDVPGQTQARLPSLFLGREVLIDFVIVLRFDDVL